MPFTTFQIGSPDLNDSKPKIVDLGLVFEGPEQGTQPTPVPATGQLFPTGTAPQQGA